MSLLAIEREMKKIGFFCKNTFAILWFFRLPYGLTTRAKLEVEKLQCKKSWKKSSSKFSIERSSNILISSQKNMSTKNVLLDCYDVVEAKNAFSNARHELSNVLGWHKWKKSKESITIISKKSWEDILGCENSLLKPPC